VNLRINLQIKDLYVFLLIFKPIHPTTKVRWLSWRTIVKAIEEGIKEGQKLPIHDVSNQRELLIGLIRKDEDVTISGQFKGRLFGYRQESFLVTYNHNEQSDWVSADDITT